MAIKFIRKVKDTEFNFAILAFDRVFGVYPEDMINALWHNGHYAKLWEVKDDEILIEVDDFLPLEKIQTAFKDYGL